MQMGSLNLLTGEGKGKDVPLAFRTALGKVAKQLRRTKRLLREDRPGRPGKVLTA
jgi:ribosome-associated translation inhibitor RaiA